jgi:predicted dehydrogenase
VAVCDTNEEQARPVATRFGIGQVYADWQEVVHHPDVDAISICTPNALHAPLSIAALEAGKHVLCEKPMARTLDEARQMLEVAEQAPGILWVGYLLRYWPEAAILRELIATGLLGEVFTVRGCNSHPARPPAHLTDAAAGGGVLLDLGGHLLDLVQYCLGDFRPVSVEAHLMRRNGFDMEDGALVWVELAGGTVLELRTTWQAPTWERNLEIWGEKGTASIPPLHSTIEVKGARLALQSSQATDQADPLQQEIDAFVAACRGDGAAGCDGRAAYRVQAIIAAAYRSAQLGRRVTPNA